MSQDFQQYIDNKTNKNKIKYLDISNNDLSGNANLKDFANLTSLNAYNNNLKLEKQHLKALIKQDRETETKILQPLPWKPNR